MPSVFPFFLFVPMTLVVMGVLVVNVIQSSRKTGSPVLRELCITFTTNTPMTTKVIGTNKKKGKTEGMGKKIAKSVKLKTIDSVTYILDIAINRWKALCSI